MLNELDRMSVGAIMTRWPGTVRVFIDWRLHCVGCPIADFHRIQDSAREHNCDRADLSAALVQAIQSDLSPIAPPRYHRQSTAGDADP